MSKDEKLAWAVFSGVEAARIFVSGRSGLACRLSGEIYCWALPVSAFAAASLANSTCAFMILSCSLGFSCLVCLSSNSEEMADGRTTSLVYALVDFLIFSLVVPHEESQALVFP